MADSTLPVNRFFAAYLQFVDQQDGARVQFIVLPPVAGRSNTAGAPLPRWHHKLCWFERMQTVTTPRPRWIFEVSDSPPGRSIFERTGYYAARNNWLAAAPVVVRTWQSDVREICEREKTPYALLNLLQKKAAVRDIVIAGPPTAPQVVTSPVSS